MTTPSGGTDTEPGTGTEDGSGTGTEPGTGTGDDSAPGTEDPAPTQTFQVATETGFLLALRKINAAPDGNYVIQLGDNVSLTDPYELQGGTVTILGSGYTIYFLRDAQLKLSGGAVLNLGRTDDMDAVTLKAYYTSGESIINATDGSVLNLYGNSCIDGGNSVRAVYLQSSKMLIADNGTITHGAVTDKNNGGGIYADDGSTINMTGGGISNCSSERFGGGIYLAENAALTVGNSRIESCTALKGSGVYVDSDASFELNGGTIADCTLIDTSSYWPSGGGVCVSGSMIMNSGTISGCIVPGSGQGGGVCVSGSNSSFIMNGGAITNIISSGSGNVDGGGVYTNGTFEMNGGRIADCTTSGVGAGVYVGTFGVITIDGGTIENCHAYYYQDSDGTLTYQGSRGGGIFLRNGGKVNLKSGTISGCSGATGGGINAGPYTYVNIIGGSIKDCTAYDNGGGLYLDGGADLIMNDGSITNCTAAKNGGGIWGFGDNHVIVTSSVICNNTADNAGSDFYMSYFGARGEGTLPDAAGMNQLYGSTRYKIDGWYSDPASQRYTPAPDAVAVDVSDLQTVTMPCALVASYNSSSEPVPVEEIGAAPSGGGAGAGILIGGVAVGAVGYAVGTRLWLEHNIGFVPTDRQQLAGALWNKAGCPAPESTALYPDIAEDDADAQAAARWCVEQGLLDDYGDTFHPSDHVYRFQAIKAWNTLQDRLNAQV